MLLLFWIVTSVQPRYSDTESFKAESHQNIQSIQFSDDYGKGVNLKRNNLLSLHFCKTWTFGAGAPTGSMFHCSLFFWFGNFNYRDGKMSVYCKTETSEHSVTQPGCEQNFLLHPYKWGLRFDG